MKQNHSNVTKYDITVKKYIYTVTNFGTIKQNNKKLVMIAIHKIANIYKHVQICGLQCIMHVFTVGVV